MDETHIIDMIHQALQKHGDSRVKDVSYAGDHKSASVIIVTETEEDGHQEWIISSSGVRLLKNVMVIFEAR